MSVYPDRPCQRFGIANNCIPMCMLQALIHGGTEKTFCMSLPAGGIACVDVVLYLCAIQIQ